MQTNDKKTEKRVLTEGKMCAARCIECVYFNTGRTDGYGSYRCEERDSWHKGSDLACSDFKRG